MKIVKSAFLISMTVMVVQFLPAQSVDNFASHVVWERDFPKFKVSILDAAATDRYGNLWAINAQLRSYRLLCIQADGQVLVDAELPQELEPRAPSDVADFSLARSPTGAVVLSVRYSHAIGPAITFDGAVFTTLHSDGTIGPVNKIGGPGPEYKELIPLSDEHFLLIGDQSPMSVLHLNIEGIVDWRHEFPGTWVLPSAAALDNGSACVASPDYGRALVHMIWLDKNGTVRHSDQLAARRAGAAGENGSCVVLYDREPQLRHGEFYLTGFDRNFKREWTTEVLANAPQGGVYGLAATTGGYAVTIGLQAGLFLARFSPDGQLIWSVSDRSRQNAESIISIGDDFYLIGAGPQDRYGLHVARMH